MSLASPVSNVRFDGSALKPCGLIESQLRAESAGAPEFSKSLKRAESVYLLHLQRGHVNL